MAVISVRLNTDEDKMIRVLSEYYEEEKSTLIKHSLKEMYEDLMDRKISDAFEKRSKKTKLNFLFADDIIAALEG